MTRLFFFVLLPLAAQLAACTAQHQDPPAGQAVAGAPAYEADTTSVAEVRDYFALVEMLYDLRLGNQQRAQLRPFVEAYRTGDAPKRQVFDNCLQFYAQLMAMTPGDRDAQCHLMRAISLEEQWKLAKTGDAEARLMLDLYYAAHPPLADGTPPLTRDIVDALMEFDYFFNVEVKGLKAEPMDADFREAMYKEAVSTWKTLDSGAQQAMCKTASEVARQRLVWQNATPEMRLQIKAEVVGEQHLAPAERAELARIRQQLAQFDQSFYQQQNQLLTNELHFMRQNQQTIMGNGTYYNQTLGRWEQHGGIVTEFH